MHPCCRLCTVKRKKKKKGTLSCFKSNKPPTAQLKCALDNCRTPNLHWLVEIDDTLGAVVPVQKLWLDLTKRSQKRGESTRVSCEMCLTPRLRLPSSFSSLTGSWMVALSVQYLFVWTRSLFGCCDRAPQGEGPRSLRHTAHSGLRSAGGRHSCLSVLGLASVEQHRPH